MRLDKYLAESWVGQRKKVRTYIKEGKVTVNGQIVFESALEVDDTKDEIYFERQRVRHPGKRYYMFHKPVGCITARSDVSQTTVLDYFDESLRAGLFPVGRLDKDTQGLLLLTNDGEFDYQMMHPDHHVNKTYYFWALGSITKEEHAMLEAGVEIEQGGGLTKPAKLVIDHVGYYDEYASMIEKDEKDIHKMTKGEYRKPVVSGYLTICEGKKHQVKRMLRAVNCYCIALKRISIGKLTLDETLEPGKYRSLLKEELLLLNYHA